MNGNKKIQLLGALFFISLLIACGAIMYAADNFGSDVGMTKWDKIYELSSGWYYETDEGRQTIASLPAEIDAGDEETDTLAMFCRLPELISENSVLQLNGNHMALEVFVDEKRVYEHGIDQNAPVGKILGNPWLLIDLPDDAAGRELSIRFTSPYGKGHFHVPEISFGDKADVLRQFLYDNIQTIALCMTAFIFATLILMLVAFFAIKKIQVDRNSLIYLAAFIFLAAIWIITDSSVLLLLSRNYVGIYIASHISFMMMPVPLMLFLRQITMYGEKTYAKLAAAYMINAMVLIGLFFFGVAELEKTLISTHLLMGIGVVVCVTLLIKERLMFHAKNTNVLLCGLSILGFGLILSLANFFLKPQNDNSFYLRFILFILMIAMSYKGILQLLAMVKRGIASQTYKELAYIDIQTNLNNRTAFEEYMNTVQDAPDCKTLAIVMVDINKLKYINDNYGHGAGDKFIKSAADCIAECFESIAPCYRIGGDEFAVILKDVSEEALEPIIARLHDIVAAATPDVPEKLTVSVGCAAAKTTGDNFAYDLLAEADRRMYEDKGDQRR